MKNSDLELEHWNRIHHYWTGVNIEGGAEITLKAPRVRILGGFRAENGATVRISENSVPGQAVEMEVEWWNQEIKTAWSGKIGWYGTGSVQWWL